METIILVVLLLLIAGVIGSIVPMMPGALFSIAGILIYFFGAENPSTLLTIFGLFTGVFTLAVDWFAGSVAAKYGGASTRTSLAAGFTGLLGFIFLGGPIGLALAVSATVFIREYLIHGDEKEGMKAAFYATLGVLGSALIQAMLTGSILIAFLLAMVI